MYGRDYGSKTLSFEASGGLTNASLVMQDKQTNTYWSLMKGQAVAGSLKGESLKELPLGEKTTWKEWRTKYPNTRVLSVDSREDGRNPYQKYFSDESGFRGLQAKDKRLDTKSPVFAFRYGGNSFAVAHREFQSGAAFKLQDGSQVFLYRQQDDKIFQSTSAFISKAGFVKNGNKWIENQSGKTFDEKSRSFGSEVARRSGFDTFWYNWSLNNQDTKVLKAEKDLR